MNATALNTVSVPLCLKAATAADLMTTPPLSIGEMETIHEAVVFLADRGFGAAPVINEAGRPVGVISKSDIVRYEREETHCAANVVAGGAGAAAQTAAGEQLGEGFQIESPDQTPVRSIMSPLIFWVSPETPAREVVVEMLSRNVHRLFVIDHSGVLVGIITAIDILRKLG